MKKVLKLLFILLLVLLAKLVLSFSINEIIIWNYNNNIYNSMLVKSLYFLNFNQPYIVYYNDGNILYKKENYNEAINKYNKALNKNPPQNKVCDIRINLSLAMIKNINFKEEYEDIYNKLEEAKNNLYNNNCASPTDDNGYSQDAEKLEEEIKELQKKLDDSSGDDNNDDSQDEEEQNNNEDYSDIEEKLKEIEKDANANRQSDLAKYENMGDYSYYDGKQW